MDRIFKTGFLLIVLIAVSVFSQSVVAQSVDVWFGTSTPKDGLSEGIYHATFNTVSGKLSKAKLVAKINNPGFLAMHPLHDVIYSTGIFEGRPGAAYFKIKDNGNLEYRGFHVIDDGGATHLSADANGRILATVQYGGGSVTTFSLDEDGFIDGQMQHHEHNGGAKVVDRRQDSPHPHWIGFDKENRFAFVPDLGLDQVNIYEFDAEKRTLTPHGNGKCPPGSGPRHMKFHPNGKFAFVLNELALSITVFAYDGNEGTLSKIQTVQTLSDEIKKGEILNAASEIRVHPSGNFVYSANRGHDSISVFRCDPDSGKLLVVEVEPIRGSWPRNFNIDPTGKWLIAAGRDSNTAAVFGIDSETGKLAYRRGATCYVPSPICVLFGRIE